MVRGDEGWIAGKKGVKELDNRTFDILIDGHRIATQKLNASKPGQFVDVTYDIPVDLTKGKQKVTVKFQAP